MAYLVHASALVTYALTRRVMSGERQRAVSIDEATDAQVDALLPREARKVSSVYWTPVRVARRAAEIFAGLGVARVLDVGSGAGKFCVAAAARAPRVAFVGVEHRLHLVRIARSLAASAGIANATFVHGDAAVVPDGAFDGFYVFNVTYYGLGGAIPSSYEAVHAEPAGTSWLRVWKEGTEAAPSDDDRYWLDDGDDEVDLVTIDDVVGHLFERRREQP